MERCDVVAHPALVDVDVRVSDQLVHNLVMQKVKLWRRKRTRSDAGEKARILESQLTLVARGHMDYWNCSYDLYVD